MAGGIDYKAADLVSEYQKLDKKNALGEKTPDQETLEPERIRSYLQDHQFMGADLKTSQKYFKENFKFGTALDIAEQGKAVGEVEMAKVLNSAKTFVTDSKQDGFDTSVFEAPSSAAFLSTVNKYLLLIIPDGTNPLDAKNKRSVKSEELLKAYLTYRAIRQNAEKSMEYRLKFTQERAGFKKETEAKSIMSDVKEVFRDLKKNFDHMDSKEKFAALASLLAISIYVATTKNESVSKVRDQLKVAGKYIIGIGLAGVGGNYLTKLFTGKSALTMLGEGFSSTAGNPAFWKEQFQADEAQAAAIRDCIVKLGDQPATEVIRKYKQALADGSGKITVKGVDQKGLPADKMYQGLDKFFKKMAGSEAQDKTKMLAWLTKLEQHYSTSGRTSRTFVDLVAEQMISKDYLKVDASFPDRVEHQVEDKVTRGWNWMWAGEGLTGLSPWLYQKVWGKPGTTEEVKKWIESLGSGKNKFSVIQEADLPAHVDQNYSKDSAKAFKGLGTVAPNTIKISSVAQDSLYMTTAQTVDLSKSGSDAGLQEALGKAIEDVKTRILKTHPDYKALPDDQLQKLLKVAGNVYIADGKKLQVYFRVPAQGTIEYGALTTGIPAIEERKEGAGLDYFINENLVYTGFAPWQQEQLRVRFALDHTQGTEAQQILDWFTMKYKGRNLLDSTVMKKVMEDDGDKEECLKALSGIKRNLFNYEGILAPKLSEIKDIEKNAAAKIDSSILNTLKFWKEGNVDAYEALQWQMRKSLGYKVRLAILQDPDALSYFAGLKDSKGSEIPGLKPGTNDGSLVSPKAWPDSLLAYYQVKCEDYVKGVKSGDKII